ncbi:MAG: ABC transporter ATP-binding protein [Desulfobacterales bacterium]|nr:ABC transporter ATP-binding protein [Desulfobacterales bacterium]
MRGDFGYFEEDKLGKAYDVALMKRLTPFVRPYTRLLFAAIFLVIIITALDLAIPYVTKVAIDRYIVPETGSVRLRVGADGEGEEAGRGHGAVDAEIDALVQKYPGLLERSGEELSVSNEDVRRLDPGDLRILRRDDLSGIRNITAVFLLLILLNLCLNFAQVMVMQYTGQQIMHDMRVRLFDHIQRLSMNFFSRNPVARLVTRTTNDIQNMNELFTSVITFIFKDMFILFGIAGVLLALNWRLALATFIVLPFMALATYHFSGHARDAFRILRVKVAEINTRFAETFSGMKVIQLFGQETANLKTFKVLNHENYEAGMRQIHVFALFMPFIELLGSITLAIVVYYGGGKVVQNSLSLGEMVAFISYVRMFFRPLRDLAEKYNVLQNAMSSAERIFLILDNHEMDGAARAPGLPGPDNGDRPAGPGKIMELALDRTSFSYVPGEPVLRDVSFHLRKGRTLAVVGPTGSGKTTLINLIIRFYDPDQGAVLVNGRDVRDLNLARLRARMALVTQDPFLFSGTILDNIVQDDPDAAKIDIDHVLEMSNCKRIVDRQSRGVQTVLSEGGASLSSGERQLISIARAFARDPDLIILDEATSYIDSETEQAIQEALRNLQKNRTTILIAHRLSTARGADAILVLHQGRVIEEGPHDELMRRKGFYFRLNQLQG